ncbi:MAG: hypothetical protein ABIP85_12410 [Chthoniobacteraceae bacterium]
MQDSENVDDEQLLLGVQNAAVKKLNAKRVEQLAAHDKTDKLHAVDDYKIGLVYVLEQYPDGLPLWKLNRAFHDVTQLRVAKDALIKSGVVVETKNGTEKVLTLVKKA